MMAMNLHIHLKLRILGSRAFVVQEVSVFGLTQICFAISRCSILFSLSLALSQAPNVFGFIVISRMV